MLPRDASIVVIGGGIVGAAIFERLTAEHGGTIVLLEKNAIATGATGKSAGIARKWGEDLFGNPFDEYRELLSHREVRGGTEMPTLHITEGCAEFGDGGEVDGAPLVREYKHVRLGPRERVRIETKSGYFSPTDVTRELVDLAESRGGILHEGVIAQQLIVRDGHVKGIKTSMGTISTDRVVIATGAWTEKLSAAWGLELPIFAKGIQMNRYLPDTHEHDTPIFIDGPLDLYGRGDGRGAVLVGMPVARTSIDPDRPQVPSNAHVEETLRRARHRFSWGDDVVCHSAVAACDGYTESGEPLVQRHPALRGLYIAVGFSGGGFKQAPSVARRISRTVWSDSKGEEICA